jgi:hypothetical protein
MSRVIAGIDESGAEGGYQTRRATGSEWVVLGSLGCAFALVSLADVALAFYPIGFGSAEWEFATATAVMNNLPLALVGIGLMTVAGLGRRSEVLRGLASILAGVLGMVVLLLAVLCWHVC